VTLDKNTLRSRVTTNITTKGGQFYIIPSACTRRRSEAPMAARRSGFQRRIEGRLELIEQLGEYALALLITPIGVEFMVKLPPQHWIRLAKRCGSLP
jgi:hypothetical protein